MSAPGFDVAVVGAGAAGLIAAIRAAERGRKVLLLEKNKKAGVKILMSGGTRCNVTHDGPPDEVARAFGKKAGRFLRPSLLAFPPERTMHFFEASGVRLKTEPPHGKVFPRSDRATDVLLALLDQARARGVAFRNECPIAAVRAAGDGFALALPGDELRVPRVVLATGGQSYPRAGTSGDGYGFARALGLGVVTPRPALVPITLLEPLPDCAGIALADARVGLAVRGGKLLATRRGELLFTHKGLSGPTALDLSGELTARTSGVLRDVEVSGAASFEVALDLIPEVPHERVHDALAARGPGRASRPVAAVVHELGVPRNLVRGLLQRGKVPEGRTVQELRREERTTLTGALKDLRLGVSGTLGFDKAEVTAGGVALEEIEPATLEARRVRGLHVIGELLDVDGPIGGYNFQAAWSTGWAAGSAV